MIYFVVGVGLLLGLSSSFSVCADGLQINEPGCGMPTRGMIVNGTAAKRNQFPWMVSLMLRLANDAAGCGGSIITKRHVLTAAHCTYIFFKTGAKEVEEIKAFYGNNDRTRGKVVMVTKITRHPKYKPEAFPNDIAVLEVEKPFQYGSNVRPICLPAAPMDIFDTEATVAGWGKLKEGGQGTIYLQYTTVRILPNELCSVLYYIIGYVSDVMVCAYRKATGPCHGDSGGPLMYRYVGSRYVQVGLVSFGERCAGTYIPEVFTRVETFMPWIKRVVGSFGKAYPSEVPAQLPSYTVPQWPSMYRFP